LKVISLTTPKFPFPPPLAGPKKVRFIARIAERSVSIDHPDREQMVAGESPLACEHAIATTEGESCQSHGFARARREKASLAEEKLIHLCQPATCTGGENAGGRIEMKLPAT
jgi:hypothetical protein